MKQIFITTKKLNIFSKWTIYLLTFMEFILFFFAIDLIFPIKNEYNYYFPLYLFCPLIYLEFTKERNYSNRFSDPDYIKNNFQNLKEKENILFYLTNYISSDIPQGNKIFSFYSEYMIYIVIILFIVKLSGFIAVYFASDFALKENKENNSILRKIAKNFYFISLKINYIFLKPLISVFLIILSNIIIPNLFFKFTGFYLFAFPALIFLVIYIIAGFIFLEYFWMAYSKNLTNMYLFIPYESIKLLNKILISFLIPLSYFDAKYFEFLGLLIFISFLMQFSYYYVIYLKGNDNTIVDFYFTNFLVAFLITRFLNFLGNLFYTEMKININNNNGQRTIEENQLDSKEFNIILLLLNLAIFISLSLKIKALMQEKISDDLYDEPKKIRNFLNLTLGKYIDYIYSQKNINENNMSFINSQDIINSLKKHRMNCISNNILNCKFCKIFELNKNKNNDNDNNLNNQEDKEILNNPKLIFKNLLEYIDSTKRKFLSEKEKNYLDLCKMILIYIIDDFKIHRLSYFLMKSVKKCSIKFKFILLYIYEKLISSTMKDDDTNFILLKYVKLNDFFLKGIEIALNFNQDLKEKSKNLKRVISDSQEFGNINKNIFDELKSLQGNLKILEKSNYFKFLWSYSLVYNEDFENDVMLDLPENIEKIDEAIFKDSYFLFNYHFDTGSWTFKKAPFLYTKNFGFSNLEIFGKNFDTIFPPILKEYEGEKLESLFQNSSQSRFNINTYLISKLNYIKNVELTFDILPAFYESSFIISNIVNYDLGKKDNLLVVDSRGTVLYSSEIPHFFLGISNKIIMTHKEFITLSKLFSLEENRMEKNLEKNFRIQLQEYYNNYANLHIYEHTNKENIEEFDIVEFYNFYQKIEEHFKKNKIYVELDLIDERNNYFFYKCNITSNEIKEEESNLNENSIISVNNSNNSSSNYNNKTNYDDLSKKDKLTSKKISKKNLKEKNLNLKGKENKNDLQILNYFNKENAEADLSNTYELKPTNTDINLKRYEETGSMRGSVSINSLESTGREFFAPIGKQMKSEKQKKSVEIISKIIFFYNLIISLFLIVVILYINIISSNILNIYKVVKDIKKINLNYLNSMTFINQIIILDDSGNYNSYAEKIQENNPNITIKMKDYLQEDLFKLTNKIFEEKNKMYNDLLFYVDIEFYNKNLNLETEILLEDGKVRKMPFFESYQQFANMIYKISNNKDYYTRIPFKNLNEKGSIQKVFETSTNSQKIILCLMYNFNKVFKNMVKINYNIDTYFSDIYYKFEREIYIFFILIIILHLISLLLSFIEIYIFQKKLLKFLDELLSIRKKELNYTFFKLNSAKNLVDLENKPSSIIDKLKVEKRLIRKDLIERERLIKQNFLKNTKRSNLAFESLSLNNYTEKNETIKPLGEDTRNEEDPGLKIINSNIKRAAKNKILLKKNKKFLLQHLFSNMKVLIFIIISYLIYLILTFYIIDQSFYKIYISSEYLKQSTILNKLSNNYLISMKLAIAFNDSITPMESGIFVEEPIELYKSQIILNKLIKNHASMDELNIFISSLNNINLCDVVKDRKEYNKTIVDNIAEFCKGNSIFFSDYDVIFSFFVQKIRDLYESFLCSDKSEKRIGEIYNSEISQLINYISIFFINPFTRKMEEDLGFTIYLRDLSDMVATCFILLGALFILDIINFVIMKLNITKKIKKLMENLSMINNSMMIK